MVHSVLPVGVVAHTLSKYLMHLHAFECVHVDKLFGSLTGVKIVQQWLKNSLSVPEGGYTSI